MSWEDWSWTCNFWRDSTRLARSASLALSAKACTWLITVSSLLVQMKWYWRVSTLICILHPLIYMFHYLGITQGQFELWTLSYQTRLHLWWEFMPSADIPREFETMKRWLAATNINKPLVGDEVRDGHSYQFNCKAGPKSMQNLGDDGDTAFSVFGMTVTDFLPICELVHSCLTFRFPSNPTTTSTNFLLSDSFPRPSLCVGTYHLRRKSLVLVSDTFARSF